MCHGKLESEVLSLLSMVKEDLLGEGKISYIHIFYYYLTATTKKAVPTALTSGQEVTVWGKTFSPLFIYLLLSNHKGIHFQVKRNILLVSVLSCLDYVENCIQS